MSGTATAIEREGGLTTAEVERLLFQKYHGADFAICFDVRNAAGFNATRACDALGIGLWPSRGCHVHGFEIKVSRSDWLRELKDGAKAEAFHGYCDFWHLVVGDKSVVRDGELPEGWGLLVPHGDSLREVVAPAKIEAAPMPRSMLAAFVKRAATQAPLEATLKQRYEHGLAQGIERGKSQAERELVGADGPRYRELRAAIDKFKAETGIDPEFSWRWEAKTLRQAVAIARASQQTTVTVRRLQEMSREVVGLSENLKRVAETLSATTTENGE